MRLTKDERKALQPYESWMRTAVEANYARQLPYAASQAVAAVHRAHIGGAVQWGCSRCALRALKEVGELYFADIAEARRNHKRIYIK